MLSDGNKSVLRDACWHVREANRCLMKGSVYSASQCCREAEERFVYVGSRSEVTATEVDEFVREHMAKCEEKSDKGQRYREQADAREAAEKLTETLEDVREWIKTGKVDGVGFDRVIVIDKISETIAEIKPKEGETRCPI